MAFITTITTAIGASDTIVNNGGGVIGDLNTAAQLAAAAASLGAITTPSGALVAVTASEAAFGTGLLVLNADIEAGKPLTTIAADYLTLFGDAMMFGGALAANVPGGKTVALAAEDLGDAATLIGVGVNNYNAVITNTPVALAELNTELNENIANIEATGNSLTPEFVSLNGNAGTAWGEVETGLFNALTAADIAIQATGSAFSAAAAAASDDFTSLGTSLTSLFSSTGDTAQNVTDTVTNNAFAVTNDDGSTIATGSVATDGNGDIIGATASGSSGGTSTSQSVSVGGNGNISLNTDNVNGTSQQTAYNPDGSSVTDNYTGLDGTGALVSQEINNPGGTSSLTTYYPDGTTITDNYSGADETGMLTSEDIENSNGNSAIITYNPDGSATVRNYSGPHGTGTLTGNFAASAGDDIVTIRLSGVTFEDGGTASGTVVVDYTTFQVLGFNIATTAGATIIPAVGDSAETEYFQGYGYSLYGGGASPYGFGGVSPDAHNFANANPTIEFFLGVGQAESDTIAGAAGDEDFNGYRRVFTGGELILTNNADRPAPVVISGGVNNLNNQVANVAANASATITGNNNIIFDAGVDLLSFTINDSIITDSGSGNTYTIAGSGNTLDVSGDSITFAAAASALISGSGNTVNVANGDVISSATGDSNTFVLASGTLASGSAIDGGPGGSNTLEAATTQSNINISQANITGIQTVTADSVTLTASQFAELTTLNPLSAPGGYFTVNAATAGTYSLASVNVTGALAMHALSNAGTTLAGNNSNSESLFASSTGNDTLSVGNGNYDFLLAGSGNDTLSAGNGNGVYLVGGAGADTLTAGDGSGDTLNAGSGNTVITAGNGNGDTLWASGNGNDTLTVGNGNGDTLHAGSGTDTMRSGTGNDTFTIGYFTGAGTVIAGGGGNDTLVDNSNSDISQMTISGVQTLQSQVFGSLKLTSAELAGFSSVVNEFSSFTTLTLEAAGAGTYDLSNVTGKANLDASETSADVTLIGNRQNAQVLTASSGTDTLTAGSGAGDILNAGSGNDALNGGGGYDSYKFGSGFGQDVITNNGGASPNGEIDFAGVSDQQLWFQQSGNNLLVDLLGTNDQITVAGWFGGNAGAQVSSINATDGALANSQVLQLVQAMAAFGASNPSFSASTATQMPNDSTLQSAIAANWHH